MSEEHLDLTNTNNHPASISVGLYALYLARAPYFRSLFEMMAAPNLFRATQSATDGNRRPVGFLRPTTTYHSVKMRAAAAGVGGRPAAAAANSSSPPSARQQQESGGGSSHESMVPDVEGQSPESGSRAAVDSQPWNIAGIYHVWRSRDNRKGRHSLAISRERAQDATFAMPRVTNSWTEVARGILKMVTRFPVCK